MLGMGLVNYHEAQQVVIWPFPFPYAQLSAVLLFVHSVLTPMVISQSSSSAVTCSILSLVSVICLRGIDLICWELDNPFGNDENDLPSYEMHQEMIQDMILLTNPRIMRVPRLLPAAKLNYRDLAAAAEDDSKAAFEQRGSRNRVLPCKILQDMTGLHSESHPKRRKSLAGQRWCKRTPSKECLDMSRSVTVALHIKSEPCEESDESIDDEQTRSCGIERAADAPNSIDPDPLKKSYWQDGFADFTREMQTFFHQQVEHLKVIQEAQLNALRDVSASIQALHLQIPDILADATPAFGHSDRNSLLRSPQGAPHVRSGAKLLQPVTHNSPQTSEVEKGTCPLKCTEAQRPTVIQVSR